MHTIKRLRALPHSVSGIRYRALNMAISAALLGGLSMSAQAQLFPPVIELGSLSGNNGFRLDGGTAGEESGRSVSNAGDINGDGIDDLIVGAWRRNGLAGSSYVVFGKRTGFVATLNLDNLNGSNGFRLDGALAGDGAGYSVSAAGDINGDGIGDLIIGAPNADPNGIRSGSSYVVFGRDTANAGNFPATLALSGLNGSDGFRLDGAATDDRSGFSVSNAGDINDDGIDDLIVGAPGADPDGNSSAGRSYVVFGKNTAMVGGFPASLQLANLNGTDGFRLDGVAAGDASGTSVSNAGDINGDGIDDLIVGAYGAVPNGIISGSSYVVFGKNTAIEEDFAPILSLNDLTGSDGFRIDGEGPQDYSGRSVAAAGDINGDGLDDLIIGALGNNPNGFSSGSSYVVFGRDTINNEDFAPILDLSSLTGNNGFRIDGEGFADESGRSVSAAGDINGDGIDDLIIGAHGATLSTNVGRSYVVFGRDTAFAGPFPATLALGDLTGADGFRLDGEAANDRSGFSVSAAGDINGDGLGDVIVGAFAADTVGNIDAGKSYVVFGCVSGTPVLVVMGTQPFDFGPVQVGGDSAPLTVTLANAGTGLVLINTIDLPNPAFSVSGGSCGALPIPIRVDESCTLDIQFAPQVEGFTQMQLTLNGTSVTSPDSIVLQGTGLAAPVVSLQPDPLDFGDIALGATAIEMLIVENTGDGTLTPGALSITGPQASEFIIQMNNCAGAQLANGQFCGIDIDFAPTAPGIRQATLSLQSNAPSSPHLVQLRGSNDVVFADEFETQ